jgi:hypothetical protein
MLKCDAQAWTRRRIRPHHFGFRKLKVILLEQVALAPDVYGLSLMESSAGSMSRRNDAATMERVMSEDDVAGVADYEGAAAGWGARGKYQSPTSAKYLQSDLGGRVLQRYKLSAVPGR